MEWTRSDTIALANNSCTQCHGLGLRLGKKERMNPCNCVLRAIFRACHARFRHCATKEKYMSRISLEQVSSRERSFSWGRKDEEYMADFILLGRRTLSEFDFKLFRFHFLLGADWKLCCRRMGIDRGTFFHASIAFSRNSAGFFEKWNPTALPAGRILPRFGARGPAQTFQLSFVPRMQPDLRSRSFLPGLLKSA